jgi:hypothetical protein
LVEIFFDRTICDGRRDVVALTPLDKLTSPPA